MSQCCTRQQTRFLRTDHGQGGNNVRKKRTQKLFYPLQFSYLPFFLFSSFPRFRKTVFKKLIICAQFPEDYPNTPLLVELKSKTLSDNLLNGLTNVCEQECKKILGKAQVILSRRFHIFTLSLSSLMNSLIFILPFS